MRGTTSSAKMRLRSGGFKCHLCGRRVVDAALLERHLKTIHSISNRKKVLLKVKPRVQETEPANTDMEKAFDDLVKDKMLAAEKPKPKTKKSPDSMVRVRILDNVLIDSARITAGPAKNAANVESVVEVPKNVNKTVNKRPRTDVRKRPEFECPVCSKIFNVYFTAYKHIQKSHPINSAGERVATNAPDLIQPIRVEECVRCTYKIRSTETHLCPALDGESVDFLGDNVELATQYTCAVCNQSFFSIKMFDIHVAGVHSDGVESMFFPNKLEFINWRLDMERRTNAKYTSVGDYESKDVYRCNYGWEDHTEIPPTCCPSTMVVQTFTKGIQVHFYPKHHDHPTKPYTLSSKYINYTISSFLKHPNDSNNVATNKALDHKDMYAHFKILMQGIVTDAKNFNVPTLKILIDKALDMANVINSVETADLVPVKPNKNMSDKEIEQVLEAKVVKRRNSEDCGPTMSSPAKRTRNKSMFVQKEDNSSPKILNAFSLADSELDGTRTRSSSKQNSKNVGSEGKDIKVFTPTANLNQSPSFNDSYKEFIDKTIQATINIGKKIRKNDHNTRSSKSNNSIDSPQITPQNSQIIEPDLNTSATTSKKASPIDTSISTTPKIIGVKRTNNINITGTPKIAPIKNVDNILARAKSESPIGNKGPKTSPKAKVTPKVFPTTSKEEINSEVSVEIERMSTPPMLKPKSEIKYEVRERENDCNILVLKI